MITVTYHCEIAVHELTVWAESDDLPGYTAAGDSFDEVRGLVREYLHQLGRDDELVENGDGNDQFRYWFTPANPDPVTFFTAVLPLDRSDIVADRHPAVPTTRLVSAH